MRAGIQNLAMLGAVLWGVPAIAADHLDCVLALRTPALDKAVFTEYRAGGNIGEALMKERGADFKACATTHKWSDSATESAARVLFGQILVAGVTQDFIERGLPVERLGAALAGFMAGQDSERQSKLAEGALDEATITPLLDTLTDLGIVTTDQLDKELGGKIGEYLSAYANASVYRMRFRTQ